MDKLLPNLWRICVFFLSLCQEAGRSEDDSSAIKGPDFRSHGLDLLIVLFLQSLEHIKTS